MMMTPLYYIGFLLLLANGIPTSEENELEKTVNGTQGGEGMMMALIAKTGKEERREDSMKAARESEDASSEKSVETSDEDEELSEEDGGKSDEDQEEEKKEELSEEDRGKSDENQDSSEEVTREDLVPCSGPITNPALVGPSRDNCANPM